MDSASGQGGQDPLPTVDINTVRLESLLSNKHQTNFSIKSEPTPEDAEHKRKKERIKLYFGLLLMIAVVAFLFFEILTGTADDKKWATGVLGGTVVLVARHVFGSAAGKEDD